MNSMSIQDKLSSIRIGDFVSYLIDGHQYTGRVVGWLRRSHGGRLIDYVELDGDNQVPLFAVVSRNRRGEKIVF